VSEPRNGVRLQIEDHDGAVATPVADKSTPRRGSERYAMRVLLARNVGDGLAGLGVDHHSLWVVRGHTADASAGRR